MRLDRLLATEANLRGRARRAALASGTVRVGDKVVTDGATQVGRFERVVFGAELVRALVPRYVLLHKPAGYVSATIDAEHPTVLDIVVPTTDSGPLHLAGRLDRATTGAVLITNDGLWSARITEPTRHVAKTYLVTTAEDIPRDLIGAFDQGVELPGDGILTRPSELDLLDSKQARLVLHEGRHHQVKRMFGAFGIRVTALHRERVGEVGLDGLEQGEWRDLAPEEVRELAAPDGSMATAKA